MSVKDFYLKVKIANIRKNLKENESLNKELSLDPELHPTLLNMKTFVRALEDIAEVEQEKLFDQERLEEQKMLEEHAAASAAKEKADEEKKFEKDGDNKDLPLSDDEKAEGKATLSSALVPSDSPNDLKKL